MYLRLAQTAAHRLRTMVSGPMPLWVVRRTASGDHVLSCALGEGLVDRPKSAIFARATGDCSRSLLRTQGSFTGPRARVEVCGGLWRTHVVWCGVFGLWPVVLLRSGTIQWRMSLNDHLT
jgi:hypothetical protein